MTDSDVHGVPGAVIPPAYTYGPDFCIVPPLTARIRPSRSHTVCPLCDLPIDVRGEHAVVQERYEGKVVAGCYAHADCARRTGAEVTPGKGADEHS